MRIAILTPTRRRPSAAWLSSVVASAPVLRAAGHDPRVEIETGNPYISFARAKLMQRCPEADAFLFIDDDLGWEPDALLRLVETPGDVVAGDYRFKMAEEEYMGVLASGPNGKPIGRADGCALAERVPGGFLKVTRAAVDRFAHAYPHLRFGDAIDLFNHGAIDGVWHGEDYAFSKRWRDIGGELWVIPDLTLSHHGWDDDAVFVGNLHEFLMRQPGGINDPARQEAA